MLASRVLRPSATHGTDQQQHQCLEGPSSVGALCTALPSWIHSHAKACRYLVHARGGGICGACGCRITVTHMVLRIYACKVHTLQSGVQVHPAGRCKLQG